MCKYLSSHNFLGRYIHRLYRVEPSLRIFRQFFPRNIANFVGGTTIFFFWMLLLLRYSSLTTVLDMMVSSLLFLFPQTFSVLFAVTNLLVSRSLKHMRSLGILFPGVSLKFLRDFSLKFLQWVIVTVKRMTIKVK